MGQELVLPDWAKGGVAPAFVGLNPQDDSLSEGIGQSYPVIGYRGKNWSFRFRGERKTFIRPDDGTPASYLDVIILGQARQKSKSYYKKYEPGQSDGERPICSSIDGVLPDPDVTAKQCDTCALCPRNVWKTDPQTGRKGRECTDYKRLAVLVLPTQTQPLFGTPVLEPAFLRVPPASLNSLAIMGDSMAAQGYHYSTYITRISFDPQKPHPEMVFRPLQRLTDEEAPVVLQMRQDAQVDRIISGSFADRGMQAVPPQEGTTLLPPGNTATGLVQQMQANPQQGQTLELKANSVPSTAAPGAGGGQPSGLQAAASVQPATNTGATQAASSPVSTGLGGTLSGGAPSAPTQQASPPPPQQAAGDTGAPDAADDDLDAKIAGMLGKK